MFLSHTNTQTRNYINHIAVLLDASSSMRGQEANVIKAVDGYIKYLARKSVEMDQETRVSVYTFADSSNIQCVIFDKDVVRLPSIAGFYTVYGNTALVDATLLGIRDLKLTCTKYGEHAFMVVAFTDGEENQSREKWTYFGTRRVPTLKLEVQGLPENWTVAAMVPGFNARQQAEDWGFPKGNIEAWDTMSDTGVEEAISTLTAATDDYMTMRTTGVSGTRKFFSTDATAVNAQTIQAAGLKPMATDKYVIVPVPVPPDSSPVSKKLGEKVWEISAFVKSVNGGRYIAGDTFYELHKSERVGGNKRLAVLEKKTGKVFLGDGVRALIGLSDQDQRVMPDFNKDYTVFIQSTSENRHLRRHTNVIIFK